MHGAVAGDSAVVTANGNGGAGTASDAGEWSKVRTRVDEELRGSGAVSDPLVAMALVSCQPFCVVASGGTQRFRD